MNKKELQKYLENLSKITFICKCSNRVVVPNKKIYSICDWCGRRVFRNEKEEFIYTLKEKMKEG